MWTNRFQARDNKSNITCTIKTCINFNSTRLLQDKGFD